MVRHRQPRIVRVMARSIESADTSVTHTASTLSSSPAATRARPIASLAIILEAARVEAGAWIISLAGVKRVTIQRGKERRAERQGSELVVSIPDKHMSKPHAALELGATVTLHDMGSSNGSFILSDDDDDRIETQLVGAGIIFRLGHTFATLISDSAVLVERERLGQPWPFRTLSTSFAADLTKLERVASSSLPILIGGETGTGKEVLARAIHERSQRPGKLVAVNCGALPPNLVEAHLFGHQRGAFSGAVKDEIGFVRAAHHGTLFLDEIGDLPLSSQVSLLRVLQEGEVTPVGAFEPLKVDVRVVSATHKDLKAAAARGEFRSDLLGRLSGFTFEAPPLRDRRTDLGALLSTLRASHAAPLQLRPDAVAPLLRYDYPMNVRELAHAVESAHVLGGGTIRAEDLPQAIRAYQAPVANEEMSALKRELERLLSAHHGNISHVAREMGKARQQVQRWVKRFGLKA